MVEVQIKSLCAETNIASFINVYGDWNTQKDWMKAKLWKEYEKEHVGNQKEKKSREANNGISQKRFEES